MPLLERRLFDGGETLQKKQYEKYIIIAAIVRGEAPWESLNPKNIIAIAVVVIAIKSDRPLKMPSEILNGFMNL